MAAIFAGSALAEVAARCIETGGRLAAPREVSTAR
jgi:hypothetical protein